MPTNIVSLTEQHAMTVSDPTTVLTVVAATIPLPKATAAALRLTCRATRLAVDCATTILTLSPNAIEGPLASESLLAVLSARYHGQCIRDTLRLSRKAVEVSIHNYKSLKSLSLEFWDNWEFSEATHVAHATALASLGQWPSLTFLDLRVPESDINSFTILYNTPHLTELRLSGCFNDVSVAALSGALVMASSLEILSISRLSCSNEAFDALSAGFKTFFGAMTNLRKLDVTLETGWQDQSFLAVELPHLESLELCYFVDEEVPLHPITSFPRPHLTSLTLQFDHGSVDVDSIFSTGSASLPALKSLELEYFTRSDWSHLRFMGLRALTSLILATCNLSADDIGHLGAGLAALPELVNLEIYPEYTNDFSSEKAMEALLSQTWQLPRLRWLTTRFGWEDNDCSLGILIDYSYKLPLLEAIETTGRISAEGFAALAEAGAQGRWPHLAAFMVEEVVDEAGVKVNEAARELCFSPVRDAWPGLKIRENDW